MKLHAVLVLAMAACSHHAAELPASGERVSGWRADLRELATELPKRHVNAFSITTEVEWRRSVDDLDRRLATLDDAHITAAFARLVAALGDAHTEIAVVGRSGLYPLALVWFEDGIFVVGSGPADKWAVGRKLVGIGHHSIEDVIAATTPLIPHNNTAGIHGQLPGWLLDPVILAGLDLATADRATFALAAADGSIRELELHPTLRRDVEIAPPRELPVHLQGPKTKYWNKYLATERLVYFAYNACSNDIRVGSVATFAAQTLAFVDHNPVDRFVIDLRSNQGGDSQLLQPLIDGLAARPALADRVFVIIGMQTFSSAVLNAMDLKRRLHATLVGGPTAGKPSSYGEVKTFELPHSHFSVQYSTKRFEFPDFPQDSLEPDLPVKVLADDWFSGRDPAMAAILAVPLPTR